MWTIFYSCLNGQIYFISFIDNYSKYIYLYLLNEKIQALNAFKTYDAEIKSQSKKKIKIVKFDRWENYYGKYTENK